MDTVNNENVNLGLKPNETAIKHVPKDINQDRDSQRIPLSSLSETVQRIPQHKEERVMQPYSSSLPSGEDSTPNRARIYLPQQKKLLMASPGVDQDRRNPQLVAEFAKDIYQSYKKNETKFLPDPNYMNIQSNINPNMRAMVIDWLVSVHRALRLVPSTLFLCINIMDRFLGIKQIHKARFQLVGLTCIIIASKYEEVYSPTIEEFGVYAQEIDKSSILLMEKCILSTIDFNLTVVTPFSFLTRFCKCGTVQEENQMLALYFAELTLLDYNFLKFAPSVIACSSIYLCNKFMNRQEAWCPSLEYYSGYTESDLKPCVTLLLQVIRDQRSTQLKALREKYRSPTRLQIANVALSRAFVVTA